MNTQLNSFFLGIYEKKSNNLIGTIIATEEMKGLKLNIGILIGNKYYFSKGYAYESLNLFINFIFKRKNYQSIVFGTNKKNLSIFIDLIEFGLSNSSMYSAVLKSQIA